jgi:predicted transcriptional regulator
MAWVPDQLREVAKQVDQGVYPTETVRTFLSWWGYKRRGGWIDGTIRRALTVVGVKTVPDFNWTYLDGYITFHPLFPPQANDATKTPMPVTTDVAHSADALISIPKETREYVDPTYRIGRLEMAHKPPTSVKPETTIDEAVGIMIKNNFSQLPVMTTEREVKGLFSWKSFGSRCAMGHNPERVQDAMDEHCEVTVDASLFSVVALIKDHDCVLVRESDKKISGIITAYDISVTFGQLGEPFLLLGEIENHIRNLIIEAKFSPQELQLARDPADSTRQIESVFDMTIGEHLRLLEHPDRWARLALRIDRVSFVKDLETVRKIRNDVAHFDPDGIEDVEMVKLREFARFLQQLQRLRPRQLK